METKNFAKRLIDLGYNISMETDTIFVRNNLHMYIASVRCDKEKRLDTNYSSFSSLDSPEKNELFELMVSYAGTPVKDR